jgi:hypothetical protein
MLAPNSVGSTPPTETFTETFVGFLIYLLKTCSDQLQQDPRPREMLMQRREISYA